MPVIYTLSRKRVGTQAEVHVRFYNGRSCDLRARTRVYVPASTWNADEGRCNISRRYESAENVQARKAQQQLDDLAQRIEKAYGAAGGQVTKEWLQKTIDGSVDQKPIHDIIDEYCDARNVAPRSRYKLHALNKHIVRYEQKTRRTLYAYNITLDDLYSLAHYLRTVANLGQNALATRFKQLRALIYWAGKPYPNPFDEFSMPQEIYGDPTFLTKEERDTIASFDGLTKAKAVQRDIFIFQCYAGCRVSDLYALTPANIRDGWLIYSPQKTSRERPITVEVPLAPAALAIVERYHGLDLRGRLLPFISDIKYNVAIRDVLRAAGITRPVLIRNPRTGVMETHPLCEVASSHLARRTFTQMAYAVNGDQRVVSTMTGHAPNSRAFARYSEVTRERKKKAAQALE